MFKVHYVGDNHCPIVEWNQNVPGPDNRVFDAWCDGRQLEVYRGGIVVLELKEDLDAFLQFANRQGFKEYAPNKAWIESVVPDDGNYSPDSIVEFVVKNQDCTFTQIKNATGISMGDLKKSLDGYIRAGTIKRKQKGSQFFYST